jgi:four helix bundle protein
LIVYREALALCETLESLGSLPGEYDLRDQLKRASASIVLNIAEGASRQSPADKRRFYLIARGSLGEVGAALDLLRIRRRLSTARHSEIRNQLVLVARLIGGLCRNK